MGLTVEIYRAAERNCDCTNGGISGATQGAAGLCLVNVDGPFHPRADYPPALLVKHAPFGDEPGRRMVRIVPAVPDGHGWKPAPGWAMMGGNYAATSDSRFGHKIRELLDGAYFYGAVPIHDRYE